MRAMTSGFPLAEHAARALRRGLFNSDARTSQANFCSASVEPLTLMYASCPILPSSTIVIPDSRAIFNTSNCMLSWARSPLFPVAPHRAELLVPFLAFAMPGEIIGSPRHRDCARYVAGFIRCQHHIGGGQFGGGPGLHRRLLAEALNARWRHRQRKSGVQIRPSAPQCNVCRIRRATCARLPVEFWIAPSWWQRRSERDSARRGKQACGFPARRAKPRSRLGTSLASGRKRAQRWA